MGSQKKKRSATRDGVRFLALPHTVLDSPAFLNLPAPAVRLLLDVARQYNGDNNGKLLASNKYLWTRGWTLHDTALHARRALGTIRPDLRDAQGDEAKSYRLVRRYLDDARLDGGYGHQAGGVLARRVCKNSCPPGRSKNTGLIPAPGIERVLIVPAPGITGVFLIPAPGTMRGCFGAFLIPAPGDYIDIAIYPEKFSATGSAKWK